MLTLTEQEKRLRFRQAGAGKRPILTTKRSIRSQN